MSVSRAVAAVLLMTCFVTMTSQTSVEELLAAPNLKDLLDSIIEKREMDSDFAQFLNQPLDDTPEQLYKRFLDEQALNQTVGGNTRQKKGILKKVGKGIRFFGNLAEKLFYLNYLQYITNGGTDYREVVYGPFLPAMDCLNIVCKPVSKAALILSAIKVAKGDAENLKKIAENTKNYIFDPLGFIPVLKKFMVFGKRVFIGGIVTPLDQMDEKTRAAVEAIDRYKAPLVKIQTTCASLKLATIAAGGVIRGEYDSSVSDAIEQELQPAVDACIWSRFLGRKKRDVSAKERFFEALRPQSPENMEEELKVAERAVSDVDLLPVANFLIRDFLAETDKILEALDPMQKIGDLIKGIMEHEICIGLTSLLEFNPVYAIASEILDAIGGVEAVGEAFIALGDEFEKVGKTVENVAKDIDKFTKNAVNEIGNCLANAGNCLVNGLEDLGEGIIDVGETIGDGLVDAGEAIGEGVVDAGEEVVKFFKGWGKRKKRAALPSQNARSYDVGRIMVALQRRLEQEMEKRAREETAKGDEGIMRPASAQVQKSTVNVQKRDFLSDLTSLEICVSAADILKVAKDIMDLILGPIEDLIGDLLEPILDELRKLFPLFPSFDFMDNIININLDLPGETEIENWMNSLTGGPLVSKIMNSIDLGTDCIKAVDEAFVYDNGQVTFDGTTVRSACKGSSLPTKADILGTTKSSTPTAFNNLNQQTQLDQNMDRTECKTTVAGAEYNGKTAVTISGAKCKRWDSIVPNTDPNKFPEKSVTGAVNYCRNIDTSNRPLGPYCYREDNSKIEYCDIPTCPLAQFEEVQPSCDVPTGERKLCEPQASTQAECEEQGCCWDGQYIGKRFILGGNFKFTLPDWLKCYRKPGALKEVVTLDGVSNGGWPEHPNANKGKAFKDTGINWSGYYEAKFEVAACSDVAVILGASSVSVTNGRQVALYIGYDNMYTVALTPSGTSYNINPIKGSGTQAKQWSIGILRCTEMRGFTLRWDKSKIYLDRLGLTRTFSWPGGAFTVTRLGIWQGRGSPARWRFHKPTSDFVFPEDFGLAKHSLTTCQDKYATMRCRLGEEIRIEGAEFGRTNTEVCQVSSGNHLKPCVDNRVHSLAVAKSHCDGKAYCNLRAANSVFGNPCSGTNKYMNIEYSCMPRSDWGSGVRSAAKLAEKKICEGKSGTLTCSQNKIRILNAIYGRTSTDDNSTPCSGSNDGVRDCGSVTMTMSIVKDLCEGKTTCDVPATNNAFGEPCQGVSKYLKITWYCAE